MGAIDLSSLLQEVNTHPLEESVAGWSSDENATRGTAGTFSESTLSGVLPRTFDAATLENSAASSPLPSTEHQTKPAKDKNTKRRPGKRFFLPSVFAFALVSLFAFLAHAHIKLPRAALLPERHVDALLDDFVNTFVIERDPLCFTNHSAFTAETPEAKAARESFQKLIDKAKLWRETVKRKDGAAAAFSDDVKQAAKETPESPHMWEVLLLQGALTCYDVLDVEERANFCPYFPLQHGAYKYNEAQGQLVLSVGKEEDREEAASLAEAQKALRANTTRLSAWAKGMQQVLEDLLAAKAEKHARGVSTDALKEEHEKDLKELNQALAFYEMLGLYVEKRTPPIRPPGTEPAPGHLKATDLYVMRAVNAAGKAFSCATKGAADTSPKERPEPSVSPPNRYIPYWLPHLLLSKQKETKISLLGMRLQAAAVGLPSFATAKGECLTEFGELLNRTLVHEEEKERLKGLDVDSPERKALERQVLLTEMQAGLAIAASMVQSHAKTAQEQKDASAEASAAARKAVADAWRRFEAIAFRWKQKAENEEMLLTTQESQMLATALQHVINGAALARTLALVEGTPEAANNQKNINITSGLVSICQLQVAQAARGPLHERGILPAWFAHILE